MSKQYSDKNINKLINLLLKTDFPIPIQVLCDELGLSRRSIFYLIKKTNIFLLKKNISPIININGSGYKLTDKNKKELLNITQKRISKNIIAHPELYSFDFKSLTSEDRLIFINYLIITSPPISINTLIKVTKTSRNTILNELKQLNSFNKKNNFYIKISPKGRIPIGDEEVLRQWVIDNFSKIIKLLENFYMIEHDDITIKVLSEYETATKSILTDDSRHLIGVFLSWYRKRLQTKNFLTSYKGSINKYFSSDLLNWTKTFLLSCQVTISSEVSYLANIMCINAPSSIKHNKNNIHAIIVHFASCLIKQFVQTSGYLYLIQNKSLLSNLTTHLISVYFRLKNNISYCNPLLKNFKTEHKDLFYLTKSAVKSQEHLLNAIISDDEICLIATYFGASLKSISQQSPKKVIVLCSSGVGTSKFLLLQLRKRYTKVHFIGPLSTSSYLNTSFSNISLILTTSKNISFPGNSTPILLISAFPSKYEWLIIHNKLLELNILNSNDYSPNNIENIISIIENYARIEDLEGLKVSLKTYFNTEKLLPSINNINSFDSTLKYIKFSSLKYTWKEAVKLSFDDLLKNNFVEKKYVNSILNLIEQHGDYMVIGKNFLLAHAKPSDGVKIKSASITLFKYPFYMDSGKSIQCIISLAPIDKDSHISFLAALLEKINNPQWCAELFSITSQETLKKFLMH